jgi:hypothetical protein
MSTSLFLQFFVSARFVSSTKCSYKNNLYRTKKASYVGGFNVSEKCDRTNLSSTFFDRVPNIDFTAFRTKRFSDKNVAGFWANLKSNFFANFKKKKKKKKQAI